MESDAYQAVASLMPYKNLNASRAVVPKLFHLQNPEKLLMQTRNPNTAAL